MTITIHRLCDKPEWAEQCEAWDKSEWPRAPELEEFFSNHYPQASQNFTPVLPQTFLAIKDNKLIGMLSLIAEDHPEFTHLTPWIASVYIVPESRYSRALYLLTRAGLNFMRNDYKQRYVYAYANLDLKRKHWEFLQVVDDPFSLGKKTNLYRYDVTQFIDLTSGA
jgi:hypothetical protein